MIDDKLRAPKDYLSALEKFKVECRKMGYVWDGSLRIDKRTNRHPDGEGVDWGWYEVFPLGVRVGYWGKNKDDLKDVDIEAWNEEAMHLWDLWAL